MVVAIIVVFVVSMLSSVLDSTDQQGKGFATVMFSVVSHGWFREERRREWEGCFGFGGLV